MPQIEEAAIMPLTAEQANHSLATFIALLQDAVNGASVGFLPPLSDAEAQSYWQATFREVAHQKRLLLGAFRHHRLVGSVQLALAQQPNAAHRAEVQKLLVLSTERKQGIGRRLMEAIEQQGRTLGRTLLVLDTWHESDADRLYRRLGYQEGGVIPGYARSPQGTLESTVIFYKQLP